ncbi:MAG: Rhomboid family protein [Solirubrobacterales bacterium]|jgi:membrane associated rhomboid family serine protease|nr:Rhomboid family protein [Solirubrobacterales bacterium]
MSTTAPSVRDERLDGFRLVAAMAAVMWVVEVVDSLDSHRLDQWGIKPHHLDGLVGVLTAPFLHVSFNHLISNTVPFLVMGFAIALKGAARVAAVTAIVAVAAGLGTWLIGPSNSVHIGASGVVFGYATYLISRGAFNRSALELGMGLVVAVFWGSALLSSVLPRDHISWQGHLCGGIGGVIAASLLARPRRRAAGTLPP